jgi:hypothetical protein
VSRDRAFSRRGDVDTRRRLARFGLLLKLSKRKAAACSAATMAWKAACAGAAASPAAREQRLGSPSSAARASLPAACRRSKVLPLGEAGRHHEGLRLGAHRN